jgi:phosphoribosylglycinamide formyltransferase-1
MAEKSIVILISGRGSNMGAILRAGLPARVAAVISNDPKARGLELARAHNVPTAVVNHRGYSERAEFDAALGAEIDRYRPDLVVMAGFMRILTPAFVEGYRGRIMNIHPSLLPAFAGLDTHRRALEAGVRVHGCTVHFVNAVLDNGPIIIQAAVPVQPGDTEERLAARVLAEEHRIYPQAIRWFCEGRIRLSRDGSVNIDTPPAPDTALASPPVEMR